MRQAWPMNNGGIEVVLGGGRYATDVAGYRAMVKYAKQFDILN